MIKKGTPIMLPAGVPFLRIPNTGVPGDFEPNRATRRVICDHYDHVELWFKSGCARIEDLLKAGVVSRDEKGELYILPQKKKEKK